MTQLDQGGWSFFPLFAYPAAALLISAITLLAIQRYSDRNFTPSHVLLIPLVAGIGEALILSNATQEPWFWLYIGTAVTIGASVALGSTFRDRQGINASISLAIMIGGILLALLWSQTPLRGVLILAVSGSVIGFAIGYVVQSGLIR